MRLTVLPTVCSTWKKGVPTDSYDLKDAVQCVRHSEVRQVVIKIARSDGPLIISILNLINNRQLSNVIKWHYLRFGWFY